MKTDGSDSPAADVGAAARTGGSDSDVADIGADFAVAADVGVA